jgi:hypothetical protein
MAHDVKKVWPDSGWKVLHERRSVNMRIRFSIREALLATTIIALAVARWLDRRQLVAAHVNYQDELGQLTPPQLFQSLRASTWSDAAIHAQYEAGKQMREEQQRRQEEQMHRQQMMRSPGHRKPIVASSEVVKE